eukprot:m.127639 g.127639  ORF g.127639 m.127639 type:complete len:192 (-) comp13014_c2_seq1:40-615(-)
MSMCDCVCVVPFFEKTLLFLFCFSIFLLFCVLPVVDKVDVLQHELSILRQEQAEIRAHLKEILRNAYTQETELLNFAKTLTQDRKVKAQKQAEKLDSQRRSVLGVVRLTNSVKPSECEAEMHSVLEMYRVINTIAEERMDRWQQLQELLRFKVVRTPSTKSIASRTATSSPAQPSRTVSRKRTGGKRKNGI